MFKFFTNLFTGESSYFNETSNNNGHIQGFDQDGNFHDITKSGNMGIDNMTGETFTNMGGGFIQSNSNPDQSFRSTFDNDTFNHNSNDMFGHDSFGGFNHGFMDDDDDEMF